MKRNSIDVSLSSSRALHFFLGIRCRDVVFPVEGRACQKSRAPLILVLSVETLKEALDFEPKILAQHCGFA